MSELLRRHHDHNNAATLLLRSREAVPLLTDSIDCRRDMLTYERLPLDSIFFMPKSLIKASFTSVFGAIIRHEPVRVLISRKERATD